jgi:uncharacterized membrane protein
MQYADRFIASATSARMVVAARAGAVWLLFLPNAPYIVTDLWHLEWLGERKPVPLWYDLAMIVSFAWTGVFLAVASLNAMHNVIRAYWGARAGLAVHSGRARRVRHWRLSGTILELEFVDVFFQPHSVIADLIARFAHPLQNPGAFVFTALFAAFMLVCYLTFASVEHRQNLVRERT